MLNTAHPSTIVILRSVNKLPCAKTIGLRSDGRPAVLAGYGRETHWRVEARNVASFDRFVEVLDAAAGLDDAIVIRGQLDLQALGGRDPALGVPRRLTECPLPGERGCWIAAERTWIPIDVDGAPFETLDALVAELPPPFRLASYWYQWTSSHLLDGDPGNLRCRLWFLADAPVSARALQDVLAPLAERLRLDTCVYRTVQPVYIARPTFVGDAVDPVAVRCGVVRGFDGDLVSAVAVNAAASDAGPTGPVQEGAVAGGAGDGHPVEIANAVERILAAKTSGSRHMHALGAGCELLALGASTETTAEVIAEVIRDQGREPSHGEVARALAWAAAKLSSGSLTTARPPAAGGLPEAGAEDPDAYGDTAVRVAIDDDAYGMAAALPFGPPQYGTNANSNALQYLRAHHSAPATAGPSFPFTLARYSETDYEWNGTHYAALEAEELAARLQREIGMQVSQTALAVTRHTFTRAAAAPFWREDHPGDAPAGACVPFANGVLDLDAWGLDAATPLRPHTPRLFTLSALPYSFDPAAKCPEFDRWLGALFDDQESRDEFLKTLGYMFIGGNPHHRIFVFSGRPRAGKGVAQRLIAALVGEEGWTASSLATLGEDFGLAPLIGKRVAIIGEMNEHRAGAIASLAIDRLKSISGGDAVAINRKQKSIVTLKLGTRFVIACNTFPAILDPSGALLDRMTVLRFEHSYAGREDRDIERRLANELPGIANRALQGLRALNADRFRTPKAVVEYLSEIRGVMSPVSSFAEDCIATQEGAAPTFVPGRAIFDAYRAWCAAHNARAIPEERFASDLRAVVPSVRTQRPRVNGARVRGYTAPGLALTQEGASLAADNAAGFPDGA